MSDKSDYGYQFSFHVDDGELDLFDKVTCFVLGYELAELIAYAQAGESVAGKPFHSDNVDRLRLILNELEIAHRIEMHDDWPLLWVGYQAFNGPAEESGDKAQ